MAWSFDLIVDMLTNENRMARELDPAGHESLRQAKELRRQYQRIGGQTNGRSLTQAVTDEFGLPADSLGHWQASSKVRPWQEPVAGHGVTP